MRVTLGQGGVKWLKLVLGLLVISLVIISIYAAITSPHRVETAVKLNGVLINERSAGEQTEARETTAASSSIPDNRDRMVWDPVFDQQVPSGLAVEVLAQLIPRAEHGDRVAARQIYLKLLHCTQALEADVSKKQAMAANAGQIHQESAEAQKRQEDLRRADEGMRLAGIQGALDECAGVTLEQYASMGRWLTQAAEAGDVAARLLYTSNPARLLGDKRQMLSDPVAVENYRRSSMRYLRDMSAQGIPEAMQNLGSAYRAGVLTQKDPILAYAYYAAAARIAPSPYSDKALAGYARGLSPEQLALAKQKADAILNQTVP